MKRLLILGVTGMLGSCLYQYFKKHNYEVHGTVRKHNKYFKSAGALNGKFIHTLDVNNQNDIAKLVDEINPSHVINCVGLIKQLDLDADRSQTIYINALLPHILKRICLSRNAFLVHFSTDCVFSGIRGMYTELDDADSRDLYGLSKYLGEVLGPGSITLRTSIIGHEIASKLGLLEWFLSQSGSVVGYSKAIFSGLPTIEIARILAEFILPNDNIEGIYHLSGVPISKYELLKLVSDVYDKDIDIYRDENVIIDRSLDSTKFRLITGFMPKPWAEMIQLMRESNINYDKNS